MSALALVGSFGLRSTREDAPGGTGGTGRIGSEIQLTDFEGERFSLADYSGTPVVLNFWASWCPPCAAEMPTFERVHEDLEDDVTFIGVNQRDQRAAAEDLVHRTGVTYRLVEDPNGRLFDALGGVGMPTTVFIDAHGKFVRIVAGQLSEDQLRVHISEIEA